MIKARDSKANGCSGSYIAFMPPSLAVLLLFPRVIKVKSKKQRISTLAAVVARLKMLVMGRTSAQTAKAQRNEGSAL